MRIRRVVVAGALTLAVAAGATSCGGPAGGGGSGGGEAAKSASARSGQAAPSARARLEVAGVEPQIVSTANAVVQVDDAARASDRAVRIAERADGYVAAQQADLSGTAASDLTLRVPSRSFRTVLDAVTALGEEQQRTIHTDEVTDEVVDLEGRMKSAQASTDRLRALLADASATTDIVALEGELAKRESSIEEMQGRLRVLGDQVALATIAVRFTEEPPPVVVERAGLPGFVDSLSAGTDTIRTAGSLLLLAVGYVLPFVPFALGGWWVLRRRRRSRPRPARPKPEPLLPPPPSAPA